MHASVFHEKDDVPEGSHLLAESLEDVDRPSTETKRPWTSNEFPNFQIPRWPVVLHSSKRLLFFLLPTFIQHELRPELVKPERLHPSAYLDGMRGLAALFVFFYHLSYSSHDVMTAWGVGEDGENRELLKLPFLRFFYTGPVMVSIFYVVSGYALSYKPIKLMRSKSWKDLLHTLSSSVFRRAIRLYLPCIVSTLFIVFLVRLGAYEPTRAIAYDWHRLPNAREHHVVRYKTLYEQLKVWSQKMWIFIHPWSFGTKDTEIDIDSHLWTIPMEFRSSLVLYLTQLGLSRLKPMLRILALISLMIWVHQKDRWEMILFYGGFLFAELDFRRRAIAALNPILPSSGTSSSTNRTRLWSAFYIFVFVVGLYLGSQPQTGLDKAPGWVTLNSWIPSFVSHKQRYWVGWAALLLVWSTSNYPPLQRIFTNAPVQYLGKISFSLYLMHGPVIHTIGYGSMDLAWRAIGRDTYFKRELGFCIAAIIDVASTIWAADVFTRAIDTPTVKFAKWLEEKCIVSLE